MSKKIYLFSLVLLALVFVSCGETKEVGRYDNWESRNNSFLDSLENVYATAPDHGGLNRLELIAAPGNYIYYKVKAGEAYDKNKEVPRPKYTDYTKVHYKGTNILGEQFDGTFTGKDPVEGGNNTGEGDSTPAILHLGSMVKGWTEAVQCMTKDDRWVIYIPWEYGYGSSDYSPYGSSVTIIGYSNLIFDITLLNFAVNEADLKK